MQFACSSQSTAHATRLNAHLLEHYDKQVPPASSFTNNSYSAAGTCSSGLRMSATMHTTSERSRHRHPHARSSRHRHRCPRSPSMQATRSRQHTAAACDGGRVAPPKHSCHPSSNLNSTHDLSGFNSSGRHWVSRSLHPRQKVAALT